MYHYDSLLLLKSKGKRKDVQRFDIEGKTKSVYR